MPSLQMQDLLAQQQQVYQQVLLAQKNPRTPIIPMSYTSKSQPNIIN